MSDRLPNLTRYVESLPHGFDSYPSARGKASLYRSMLDENLMAKARSFSLPAPLNRMLTTPYPVSSWIPEVHSNAMLLAIRDLACTDDDGFEAHAYAHLRRLFEGPLYRVLLKLASPSLLVRAAGYRWASFHRGSGFTVEASSAHGAEVRIEYPAHLWNPQLGLGLKAGLRAIVDISGARDCTMDVRDYTPQSLRIVGQWRARG